MMYNKIITTYFFNPLHVGILKGAIHAHAKNMDLYIYIDRNNKITEACFKSNGNPYMIAGLEWLCRILEGDLISNHPKINYKQIAQVLEIPTLKHTEALALEGIYKMLISKAMNRGIYE